MIERSLEARRLTRSNEQESDGVLDALVPLTSLLHSPQVMSVLQPSLGIVPLPQEGCHQLSSACPISVFKNMFLKKPPTSVLTPSTLEQTLAPVLKGSSFLVKGIIIKHQPYPRLPRCEDSRARRVLLCPPSSTSE